MKTISLAFVVLTSLCVSCSSRLYLRQESCEAGLRLETEKAWLTFRKQDVLNCATVVAARYQKTNVPFANHVLKLRQQYAADTIQLTIIPELDKLQKLANDPVTYHKAELFFIVDAYLIRMNQFCGIDSHTKRTLPWVEFRRIKGSEDSFSVLLIPDGNAVYHTSHFE